jgi:hypothetical protein
MVQAFKAATTANRVRHRAAAGERANGPAQLQVSEPVSDRARSIFTDHEEPTYQKGNKCMPTTFCRRDDTILTLISDDLDPNLPALVVRSLCIKLGPLYYVEQPIPKLPQI